MHIVIASSHVISVMISDRLEVGSGSGLPSARSIGLERVRVTAGVGYHGSWPLPPSLADTG